MDPKVKNFFLFLFKAIALPLGGLYLFYTLSDNKDPFRLFGQIVLALAVWRISLHVYRRLIQPSKAPEKYGKWAIVTGSTSGIGKEFADYLAKRNMGLMIVSRNEDRLKEQASLLQGKYTVPVRYLAFDYTIGSGEKRDAFYVALQKNLKEMDQDGGIGLLVNNVGIANEIPRKLDEFTTAEIDDMIQCNIGSLVHMTHAVLPFMTARRSGAVVSISSGSGNLPAPYLAVYSATKAFMTQFTRSLKIEWWDSGVDFLAVTPFYVVSNLYKRKSGSLLAPMPIKLVEGTFCQLGKRYIWQGHGYWFHGFIGNFAAYYWGTTARNLKMMKDNRARYEERQAAKAAEKKNE